MSYSDFLEQIRSEGVARSNRFNASIVFPQQIRNPLTLDYFLSYGITQNHAFKANMMCELTEFPSKSLMTIDKRNYGPMFKMPYNKMYDDLNMTFLVTADMREKRFFDAWMDMIIDPKTGDSNYYKEYTSTIFLTQLDINENEVYGLELTEAYPLQISPMPLDNTATDEIHRLNVVMTYRKALNFNTIIPQKLRAYAKVGETALNFYPEARNALDSVLTERARLNKNISDQYTKIFDLFKN